MSFREISSFIFYPISTGKSSFLSIFVFLVHFGNSFSGFLSDADVKVLHRHMMQRKRDGSQSFSVSYPGRRYVVFVSHNSQFPHQPEHDNDDGNRHKTTAHDVEDPVANDGHALEGA